MWVKRYYKYYSLTCCDSNTEFTTCTWKVIKIIWAKALRKKGGFLALPVEKVPDHVDNGSYSLVIAWIISYLHEQEAKKSTSHESTLPIACFYVALVAFWYCFYVFFNISFQREDYVILSTCATCRLRYFNTWIQHLSKVAVWSGFVFVVDKRDIYGFFTT